MRPWLRKSQKPKKKRTPEEEEQLKKAISESTPGKKVLFTCCSTQLIDYVKHTLFKEHPEITSISSCVTILYPPSSATENSNAIPARITITITVIIKSNKIVIQYHKKRRKL